MLGISSSQLGYTPLVIAGGFDLAGNLHHSQGLVEERRFELTLG